MIVSIGVGSSSVFSLISEGVGKGQAMGAGTGIPAAMGAILMQKGKVKGTGVLPPEACVDAMQFLSLVKKIMKVNESDESSSMPLIIQRIDSDGKIEKIEI